VKQRARVSSVGRTTGPLTLVKAFSGVVLERDKGSVFDARVNSGEHGHSIDAHDVKVKGKCKYKTLPSSALPWNVQSVLLLY